MYSTSVLRLIGALFANAGKSASSCLSCLSHNAAISTAAPQRQKEAETTTTTSPQGLQSFEEVRVPVPWGHVAAKWWGRRDITPVIGLHGFEDNAGTFDRLVPLLNIPSFFAWDDLGHGRSSHCPPGSHYTFLASMTNLQRVIDHHGWQKVSFIGHSFGSSLAFMYASLYPDRVERLIGLDCGRTYSNIVMGSAQDTRGVALMKKQIEESIKSEKNALKDPPAYKMDDLAEAYCQATYGSIKKEHAHHLLNRGSVEHPDKSGHYYLSRDARFRHNRYMFFLPDDATVEESSRNIRCRVLSILGSRGQVKSGKGRSAIYTENFFKCEELLKQTAASYEFHVVEGTHHVHLNNPERVAPLINKFFAAGSL